METIIAFLIICFFAVIFISPILKDVTEHNF